MQNLSDFSLDQIIALFAENSVSSFFPWWVFFLFFFFFFFPNSDRPFRHKAQFLPGAEQDPVVLEHRKEAVILPPSLPPLHKSQQLQRVFIQASFSTPQGRKPVSLNPE